ncbi:MAG TPA: hypothetical protein VGU72_04370 [Beijerinckiaceae bacterium]|jgi:hypothetical protein|nr:hypothetical protein [Beijerinckiaceae bacterium]
MEKIEITATDQAERTAQWRDYMLALIARIERRAFSGKTCILTPETALTATRGLRIAVYTPTREELVNAVFCGCKPKCDTPCTTCLGRANQVINLYQER